MTNRPCYKHILYRRRNTADEHEWAVNFEEDKEVPRQSNNHGTLRKQKQIFYLPCENKDYRQSNSHIYIKQLSCLCPVKCIQVAIHPNLYLRRNFYSTHNSLMTRLLFMRHIIIEMKIHTRNIIFSMEPSGF